MTKNYVNVDDLAKTVIQNLKKYGTLVSQDMKKAVRKTANFTRNEITANAPKRTGAYAKSWTARKTMEESEKLSMQVYSKDKYMLVHLLENGHDDEDGLPYAKAYPHVAPAEEKAEKMLVDLINDAIKKG